MGIRETLQAMRATLPALAASSLEMRNAALAGIAEGLREHRSNIFEANQRDMEAARAAGLAPASVKRLRYDEEKLQESLRQLSSLIRLPDPLGRISLARSLDEGLILRRMSCPIGVIGIIFEARPDALVQIGSLCIKSGNAAILKGGREAQHTCKALFSVLRDAVVGAGLPKASLALVHTHEDIDELLSCEGEVDLLIPRGSAAFVSYIMDHTHIPVMGHADGICHIYVHMDADRAKALAIIVDAKTQYPAACNAVETLLIDRSISPTFLPQMAQCLAEAHAVQLYGTEEVLHLLEGVAGIPAPIRIADDGFGTEYGDYAISCKLVDGVDEAIAHINHWGSGHTDAIVTENDEVAARFLREVDSAGVYRNCSTRFADGFRYGFGAEAGIATGRLHARGPVGLDGLVSYKYILEGEGHTVDAYASGQRQFQFRDLEASDLA